MRVMIVAGLAAAVLTAGCATEGLDLDVSESGMSQEELDRRERGTLFGEAGVLSFGRGGDGEQGAQLPVNRFIWRASLETLAFLPLASTDPYGGVIVTDWGSAEGVTTERFKVTAYITSAEFRPQSLRVVVNRQTRDESGQWVAAGVSPETGRQLEDAILTRARQMRIAARDDS